MHRLAFGRLALLVVPSLVAAQPAPPPGATVRWSDVAAAVDAQPALLEAAARARGAAGAAAAAGELPGPAFGLSVGEGRAREGGAARREWGASVELPLDVLATRGARVAAAAAAAEGTRQEALTARAQALRELRRAFVALVHAQATVEVGAALEVEVARLAELVRRRVDRGEGRPTEVPRVELELERLRGGLERSRAAVEARRRRLGAALGAPVARAEGDLAAPLPLPPLDELLARQREADPRVLAARARVEAAEAAARAERWERLPKLALGGAHAEELDRTATTVSATLTVPLWGWNRGRIQEAEASLDAERARLEALSRGLSTDLGDAWLGCDAGQAAARRFAAEVLPRAEGSARTLGRAFELGEAGLLDVIDARRVLLDARREHLDLLLDVQDACGDLAALAGLELP